MRTTRPVTSDSGILEPGDVSPEGNTSTDRVLRSIARSRLERRTVFLALGAVVGAWLFIVFANALADASAQSSRLERERAVNAALQTRVDAGSVEIASIQGRTFLDFLARSYGMGEPQERQFALAPGAPAPPAMRPLGLEVATQPVSTPLEDWLDLLLGG